MSIVVLKLPVVKRKKEVIPALATPIMIKLGKVI